MSHGLDRRMNNVMKTISAPERVAASLRRWKEGKRPDRAMLTTMPGRQDWKFQELLTMAGVANGGLALLLLAEEERVNLLQQMLATLFVYQAMAHTLRHCADALAVDERGELPALKRPGRRGSQGLAKAPTVVAAEATKACVRRRAQVALEAAEEHTGGFGSMPKEGARAELARRYVALLQQAWLELRAIEDGLTELEERLLGEDPLAEAHRALLDECIDRLRTFASEATEVVGTIELGEPTEEQVGRVRDMLRGGS